MTHTPKIVVVGSSNMDLTFHTPRLPRPGETLAGTAFHQGFGGIGANQAVMAARLGAQVTMISRVGNDTFGQGILKNFAAEGIDTVHVTVDENCSTGVAAITVDEGANNSIIVIAGANGTLTPEHIREAAVEIQEASTVICQLETPIDATMEAFRIARSAGVRTILNPAPAATLPDELLQLSDFCIPNETETELLTGLSSQTPSECEQSARVLQRRGVNTVIITLGERGAVIATKDHCELAPAVKVDAVDPTGAGDAFIGSLAVFLAEGLPLRLAVSRANEVAAISVTRKGALASFPRREEISKLV